MGISRRDFLKFSLLSAGVAGGIVGDCFIEPSLIQLTQTQVKLKKRLAQPLRIVHLSDIHHSDVVPLPLIHKAIELVREAKPDLICLTGDYITWTIEDLSGYQKSLALMPTIAPTYAVLGNHDGGSWAWRRRGYKDVSVVRRLLETSGIALLHNRSELVTVKESQVRLVGSGDFWSGEVDASKAFAEVRDGLTPAVLLSHNPDAKNLFDSHPWDLMLCGHTHGGQLVVPFFGFTPFAPVKDKNFVSGLKLWNGRPVYITRGVGSLHGVRFNCRPEVSVLDLV